MCILIVENFLKTTKQNRLQKAYQDINSLI